MSGFMGGAPPAAVEAAADAAEAAQEDADTVSSGLAVEVARATAAEGVLTTAAAAALAAANEADDTADAAQTTANAAIPKAAFTGVANVLEGTGAGTYAEVAAVSAATVSTHVKRDAAGRAKFVAPAAAGDALTYADLNGLAIGNVAALAAGVPILIRFTLSGQNQQIYTSVNKIYVVFAWAESGGGGSNWQVFNNGASNAITASISLTSTPGQISSVIGTALVAAYQTIAAGTTIVVKGSTAPASGDVYVVAIPIA